MTECLWVREGVDKNIAGAVGSGTHMLRSGDGQKFGSSGIKKIPHMEFSWDYG